jgi:hypothetical protein
LTSKPAADERSHEVNQFMLPIIMIMTLVTRLTSTLGAAGRS